MFDNVHGRNNRSLSLHPLHPAHNIFVLSNKQTNKVVKQSLTRHAKPISFTIPRFCLLKKSCRASTSTLYVFRPTRQENMYFDLKVLFGTVISPVAFQFMTWEYTIRLAHDPGAYRTDSICRNSSEFCNLYFTPVPCKSRLHGQLNWGNFHFITF